jgi:ATP-binding cassette, subfamily B, bacterial
MNDKKRSYTDLQLYKRLFEYARPFRRHIIGIFLLSLLSTPLTLLTPLPLKLAVDNGIGSQPLPWFLKAVLPSSVVNSGTAIIVFAAIFMITVVLLNEVRERGNTMLRTYTGEKLVQSFRRRLFQHVQRLSLSYHDREGVTDSVYRIQYDAPAIQYIAIDGVIPFITAAFTLASMIYVTALLDWQLALVALTVSPFFFIAAKAYRLKLRKKSRELKDLEKVTLSVIQETLGAIRIVKAFGREDHEQERFINRSNEDVRAKLRLALEEGRLGMLVSMTTVIGTAAVLLIGSLHVKSGVLTLGELLLVIGYLSQLYTPMATISRKVASLQSHLTGAERAFSLLDEEPEVSEKPNARSLLRAAGAVEFRNVSFEYGENRPVLQNVSFKVVPGSRVGIAGRTGAGKTTLISLLTRFYDPTDGQILLDGIDLRDYKLADARNQFGMVLQEPVLFSTSILENIAYARPEATMEEIIEAAKAANAHDFISKLPEGYETQVGERGMQISGGERQRISLARAFLKNAPILILDEPTSSIDVKTEALIIEALERLMAGRTTFMIAHRLTTLENCDVRLELEGGRLIESNRVISATAI